MTNSFLTGAQSTGDSVPMHLAEWLACLAFFMWFVLLCMKFAEKLRGKEPASTRVVNQPLEVRAAVELVRAEECLGRHGESMKAVLELRQRLEAADRVSSIQRKSMYEKVDQVRAELTGKIDEMPQLIVTQLLNTKQLWRGH